MEISKLTICRQDVIIVSDTDTESDTVNSNKKKKHKRRTTCIRSVKMTKAIVNRIVPYCHRHKCRSGQHYHRETSLNTKYRKNMSPYVYNIKYKKNEARAKSILSESNKTDGDIDTVLTKNVYSPITIASSSDTYEKVSSCSFNIQSSDSDEIEDLINITRKRMKNGENFDCYPLRKSICTTNTQDDYQNISSNDELLNSSIHSMDTVVLCDGDTMPPRPRSPEHVNQAHLEQHTNNNNNIEPMILYKDSNLETEKLFQQQVSRSTWSSQDNSENLSPIYEISGKVFMEHYLNTNII